MPDEGTSAIVSSWSCFNCRQRKARCTRHDPCAQCAKSGLQCVFPSSGRMPTRQHDPATASTVPTRKNLGLLNRVRQLEATVQKLSSQLGGRKELGRMGSDREHGEAFEGADGEDLVNTASNVWNAMHNEIQSLRKELESETPDTSFTPEDSDASEHHAHSHPTIGTTQPNNESIPEIYANLYFAWDTYVESVDPFIKVLHVPSFANVILNAAGEWDLLPVGLRCLFFAITLAAVNSMSDIEVLRLYGRPKEHLLSSYARLTEQCIASAEIQYTHDIRVLQGTLIYLEIVGSISGLRSVWIMVGLLVRAAASMGLNRDGAKSPHLSPFEVEMRRRLWWHICYLDFRIAQCDIPEMAISKSAFDTKMPLNVNDEDIDPDMTSEPQEREGLSDVSFSRFGCMIWRQSQHIFSAIFLVQRHAPGLKEAQTRALEQLELATNKVRQEILNAKSPKRDVHLFVGFMAKLILQQYLLVIRHLDIFSSTPRCDAGEQQRRATFLIAVACLESKHAWQKDPRFRRWTWVLQTFPQWYSIAIVLLHVRALPWGPTCEKAMSLALAALREVPGPLRRECPLGQALGRMLAAAKLHRKSEIQRLEAHPAAKRRLDGLSKHHVKLLVGDSPEMGAASFDTSAAAELLTREIATSLGETLHSEPLINPMQAGEGCWQWLTNEQVDDPEISASYGSELSVDGQCVTDNIESNPTTGIDLGWYDGIALDIENSMAGYCATDGDPFHQGQCSNCFHADPAFINALFNTPLDEPV